jgi:hypothetical protein
MTGDAPIDGSAQVQPSAAAPGDSGSRADVESLLPADCARPAGAVYSYADHEYLLKDYGGKGCKLAAASPEARFLAYVSPAPGADGDGEFFADTVYLLDLSSGSNAQYVYAAQRRNLISELEWVGDQVLIVWEAVWEEAFVLHVLNAAESSVVTQMRADDMSLHWNLGRTAFYVTHSGAHGREICARQLGGYDLASGTALPDMGRLIGLQGITSDSFGIPYAQEDSLRLDPFRWSDDGMKLWLTITPLAWQGSSDGRYELGPVEAGVLEFSETGAGYSVVASTPDRDYSFEPGTDHEIVYRPYQATYCP